MALANTPIDPNKVVWDDLDKAIIQWDDEKPRPPVSWKDILDIASPEPGTRALGRSLVKGVSTIPGMFADAATGVANQFLPEGRRFKTTGTALDDLVGQSSPAENVMTSMIGAGSGGAAAKFAGGKLAPLGENILQQVLSAGTGMAASESAREMGGGSLAQLLASVLGAGIVPATQAIGTGIRMNLTEAGRDTTKGRMLNQAASGNRPQIMRGLYESKQFVPNEAPTAMVAAEGAKSPTFSALGELVMKRHAPDTVQATDDLNQAARLAALRYVGGTSDDLAQAIGERASKATQEYGAAFAQNIKGDPQLGVLLRDPFIKREIGDAKDLLKGRLPKQNITEFLQNVKIGIDKKLSKTGDDALSSAQKNAAQDAKDKLLAWLGNKNPTFEAARANFAKRSVPVNQMEIGQFLEGKLLTPLSQSERPGSFAQSLRDAPSTIKRATGGPRFDTFDKAGLTQDQTSKLGGIKASLEREASVDSLASLGMPKAQNILGSVFKTSEPPPLLHRAITITRSLLEGVGLRTMNKTLDELGEELRDPQKVAALMRNATPNQRAAMMEVIRATAKPTLAGSIYPMAQTKE
jgi:hypothetical protein